jgi:hypothetical protein
MCRQGVLALLCVHSPHSIARNPNSTPTKIPIHWLSLSPQLAQPKEWDPPSLPCSPSVILTSLQGSNAHDFPGIFYLGTPKIIIYSKNAHNILLKALEPIFSTRNIPYRYTIVFLAQNTSQKVIFPWITWFFLFSTLKFPLSLKNQHVKLSTEIYSNFLFFSCKIESHISQKVVVLRHVVINW